MISFGTRVTKFDFIIIDEGGFGKDGGERLASTALFCYNMKQNILKQARSGEGSLRDEIPQAGLGGSPMFPCIGRQNCDEGKDPAWP